MSLFGGVFENLWEAGSPTSSGGGGGGGGGGGPTTPDPRSIAPPGGTVQPRSLELGTTPESAAQAQINQLLAALHDPQQRRKMAGELAMQVGTPPPLPQNPPPYIPMPAPKAPTPRPVQNTGLPPLSTKPGTPAPVTPPAPPAPPAQVATPSGTADLKFDYFSGMYVDQDGNVYREPPPGMTVKNRPTLNVGPASSGLWNFRT